MSIYQTEYMFQIVRAKSDNLFINRELVVEARSLQTNIGNLHLKLKVSDRLTLDSILFMNHNQDYLAGHFDFRIAPELERSLKDLMFKINNPSEDNTFISTRWENFSTSFKEWFKIKLIPLLQKEFETSNLLFEGLDD